ncbi:Calcineurin-like phosphoesterase [Paenibacillaceae bacterium GAS479]|nr:Calcineurin-like phosphoesterase [Paenibacillaceae bacterium GAS479]
MKLIVMGDLHYSSLDESMPELEQVHTAYYSKLIERFLEQEADYHISLGDLTNLGSKSELAEIYELIGRWNRRFIQVLGNHDLNVQSRADVLAQTGQLRYHRIETDEVMLAFLDTARDQDLLNWGGFVDEEQLAWLEETVVASGNKPLLVFAHHPVYKTTVGSEEVMGSIDPDIDMWRALNRKEGVGVYFNGHTHNESIAVKDNWTFVQMAACLDVPAFRIVQVEAEEIVISTSEALDKEITEGPAVLCAHMNHFSLNTFARGQESDLGTRVPLKNRTGSL